MSDFRLVINTLVDRWRAERIELLEPLRRDGVVDALSRTGRRYSSDIVELYCLTGGMADCQMDSRGWSFWSLDEVISENAGNKRSELWFADFLIRSHHYCFKFESERKSSVWIDYFGDHEPQKVAEGTFEFFESMLTDPGRLQLFDD